MKITQITVFLLILQISLFKIINKTQKRNKTLRRSLKEQKKPVIGLVSQPEKYLQYDALITQKNYISTLIIETLSKLGATVIEIPYNETDENLIKLISQVNGIYFSGGQLDLVKDGRFTYFQERSSFIIEECIKQNDKNHIPIPIIGQCQGMQSIIFHFTKDIHALNMKMDNTDTRQELTITDDSKGNFSKVEKEQNNWVQQNKILYFNHHYALMPDYFESKKELKDNFYISSTSLKQNTDIEFIASIQHKTLPIIGIQFHPEELAPIRNGIEQLDEEKIQNNSISIKFKDQFFKYFIELARQNTNSFNNQEQLEIKKITIQRSLRKSRKMNK